MTKTDVQQKSKKLSKNMQKIKAKIDNKAYTCADAVKFLQDNAAEKFNSTIDIALVLNIDPRHADQNLRVVSELPYGTGKQVKVAVITRNESKQSEAKEAGADLVGAENIIDDIAKGQINFDVLVATPDMMAMLGKVAKILGPKGIMPNPKLGTVTMDVAKVVKSSKAGRVELRAEKEGIVHAGIGKKDFLAEQLVDNIKFVIDFVNKSRPSGAKGKLIKAVYISTTMSPSIKLNIEDIA